MAHILHHDMTLSIGDAGRALVAVTGEVDASSADRLRRAIVATGTAQSADVEVDLAGVTFMDSTGFRAMADAASELLTSGLGLVVCNVPRQVQRLLELIDTRRSLTVRA